MSFLARVVLILSFVVGLGPMALARDEARPSREVVLVTFASDAGLARFERSGAKVDFAPLANQFEAQSNMAFCGPTTAAIVLNALRALSPDLPRDRSRLRAEDLQYFPGGIDLTVPRFTQDSVIGKGRKTRAQVLGEPVIINGKPIMDVGYQLRQFDELLRAHDLVTRLTIVTETMPLEDIRATLVDNLKRRGDYVIVNYRRDDVGQRGGGHISPLGAYDAESDSFLVLDVNPASAGWVWMPAEALVRGMRTFDMVETRGYILVQSR